MARRHPGRRAAGVHGAWPPGGGGPAQEISTVDADAHWPSPPGAGPVIDAGGRRDQRGARLLARPRRAHPPGVLDSPGKRGGRVPSADGRWGGSHAVTRIRPLGDRRCPGPRRVLTVLMRRRRRCSSTDPSGHRRAILTSTSTRSPDSRRPTCGQKTAAYSSDAVPARGRAARGVGGRHVALTALAGQREHAHTRPFALAAVAPAHRASPSGRRPTNPDAGGEDGRYASSPPGRHTLD